MLNSYTNTKEPDILEVISDLSNDEVFTPPSFAKQILDLLPADVWKNPSLRWIDPFTKTGVFLREITKRLLVGLEEEIPDEQKRLEHILRNMVFGVAITELTSLISRRSLYCAKWANSEKSVVKFPSEQGNLIYPRVEHEFFRGRCSECLAAEAEHGGGAETENYAYALLHQAGRRFIEKEIGVKFDIVVGNPPYQSDDESDSPSSSPIYNLFVDQAMRLSPQYLSMIIPSRWMVGGKGLDSFRQTMLSDNRLVKIVDYQNAAEIFPQVGINGGICYFLWDAKHDGDCTVTSHFLGEERTALRKLNKFDVLLRDYRAESIVDKVASFESIEDLVSARKPFGLATNFSGHKISKPGDLPLLERVGKTWVTKADIQTGLDFVPSWKVAIRRAGSGREREKSAVDTVIFKPEVLGPNWVCTETFLLVGPLQSEDEANSVASYVATKFFRFLVSLRKAGQDAPRGTYKWVPRVTFDRLWTDEELVSKFGITDSEWQLIDSRIKEMVLG